MAHAAAKRAWISTGFLDRHHPGAATAVAGTTGARPWFKRGRMQTLSRVCRGRGIGRDRRGFWRRLRLRWCGRLDDGRGRGRGRGRRSLDSGGRGRGAGALTRNVAVGEHDSGDDRQNNEHDGDNHPRACPHPPGSRNQSRVTPAIGLISVCPRGDRCRTLGSGAWLDQGIGHVFYSVSLVHQLMSYQRPAARLVPHALVDARRFAGATRCNHAMPNPKPVIRAALWAAQTIAKRTAAAPFRPTGPEGKSRDPDLASGTPCLRPTRPWSGVQPVNRDQDGDEKPVL